MFIEILCAILLIFVWIFIEFQEWPSIRVMKMMRKIPGPPETIFFGHGLTLRKVKYEDLLGFFGSWCKEYGPIFKIWRIGIPCVILTEPEDIETLLSSTVHIKKGLVYERLKNWLGEGLLISRGLKWKYRRRILTPAFHFKILEDCISGFQNDSQLLIKELLETNGNTIEVEPFISKFTLRVLCETAMGLKLDQLPDCGNQYRDGIKHMNRTMIRRIMSPFYRVDWFFNLSPFGREQAKVVEVLHSFTDTVIEERKRLIKSNTDKSSVKTTGHHKQLNTFLDCLIELSEQESELLSPSDIREEVDTFMFEGHDTTSAAITAVIFMIGHHPEIQEKVVEEIINIFGMSSINTTKNELNKLKYLECVIKETLRLFPSVPTILRNLESDLSLRNGEYILPRSCNVMIFPYWLHRNSDTFPEPELFIPERFMLDESCSRHPYSYIPFSGGPRNCIGQRFALIEMKIVLATILQKAKIVSISKLNDIKFGTGLILRPLSPFKVQITPRQLNI